MSPFAKDAIRLIAQTYPAAARTLAAELNNAICPAVIDASDRAHKGDQLFGVEDSIEAIRTIVQSLLEVQPNGR